MRVWCSRLFLGRLSFFLLLTGVLGVVGCANDAAATSTPPSPTITLTPESTALPTWTPVPTVVPGGLFVQMGQTVGSINPLVYGTNYGPWLTVPPDLIEETLDSGLTLLRFPGGNWGDQYDLKDYHIDRFIRLCEQMGAEPLISVRLLNGTPEQAAALVHYTNVENQYGVRYWSIGNEPSLYDEYTVERYNQEWRVFAQAMREVDPSIILVGPDTHQYTGNPAIDPKDPNGKDWLRSFLEANGDMVDIVAVHRYPFPQSRMESATIEDLRQNSQEWDSIIPNLRQAIRDLTGRDLSVAVTEVNSHWSSVTGGEATPDSFYNALWWGDSLGRMITQGVDMVAHFALQSNSDVNGLGLLARYEVRPTYYVYQMYRQFGTERLIASSDVADVTIYAAQRVDGTVTLMVINLGDEAVDVPLRWENAAATLTASYILFDVTNAAAPQGSLTLTNGDTIALPAQSMNLLVIQE